jgi:hypothetical protein
MSGRVRAGVSRAFSTGAESVDYIIVGGTQ